MAYYPEYAAEYRRKNKTRLQTYHKEHYASNKGKYAAYYTTNVKDKPELKERQWANNIKRHYDLTAEQYYEMLAQQNGQCKICCVTVPGPKNGKFCIDHCHQTGKIRGLLCSQCNKGLGAFKDNPTFLLEAAKYLS